MLQSVNIKPGEKIKLSSGIYHIESEIGSGGFGTVFKGIKDDNYYAVKLNRIWELMPDDREDFRRRIKLEYEISNKIHSEHIVHTFSYDELNENPVLVMDYCPDGSLRKKIGKSFNTEDLNRIIIQILSGLNVLHSHNIIHRDIKPENILFNSNTALLTDFGISANLNNRLTQRNIRGHSLKVFATLSYSPPEQSQKIVAFKLTGPTNDIFSFGVILYEMITEGKLPFGDIIEFKEDSEVVERRKIQGEWNVEILKKYTNNQNWIEIIEKCLHPDPRMRFQTANEVIQKLNIYNPDVINQDTNWKLIVLVGPDKGKEYNITNLTHFKNKRILTIGRFDEHYPLINDIPIHEISSNYISIHHGTLECIVKGETPTWYLRDGQWYNKDGEKGWYFSTNGITVNETRVSQAGIVLKNNDLIKIGKIVMKIICG